MAGLAVILAPAEESRNPCPPPETRAEVPAVCDESVPATPAEAEDEPAQVVISKLKLIATLQPAERIDLASLSVQGAGVLSSLYRTFLARGESRGETFAFVRRTLDEAFVMAAAYLSRGSGDDFDQKVGWMIVRALRASREGTANLKATYADDRMYVSRIDTLIEFLDARIAELVADRVEPA
jgi:hypothetical protein